MIESCLLGMRRRPQWLSLLGSSRSPAAIGLANVRLDVAQADEPRESISEIDLVRNCFGCQGPYRLTFKRDGVAILQVFGIARYGASSS